MPVPQPAHGRPPGSPRRYRWRHDGPVHPLGSERVYRHACYERGVDSARQPRAPRAETRSCPPSSEARASAHHRSLPQPALAARPAALRCRPLACTVRGGGRQRRQFDHLPLSPAYHGSVLAFRSRAPRAPARLTSQAAAPPETTLPVPASPRRDCKSARRTPARPVFRPARRTLCRSGLSRARCANIRARSAPVSRVIWGGRDIDDERRPRLPSSRAGGHGSHMSSQIVIPIRFAPCRCRAPPPAVPTWK